MGVKKPVESKPVTGKVGNYRAPVDTAGMDPKMKEMFGFGPPKAKKTLMERIKARMPKKMGK